MAAHRVRRLEPFHLGIVRVAYVGGSTLSVVAVRLIGIARTRQIERPERKVHLSAIRAVVVDTERHRVVAADHHRRRITARDGRNWRTQRLRNVMVGGERRSRVDEIVIEMNDCRHMTAAGDDVLHVVLTATPAFNFD